MRYADVLAGHHQVVNIARIETPERDLMRLDRLPLPVTQAEVMFDARVVQAEVSAADGRHVGK